MIDFGAAFRVLLGRPGDAAYRMRHRALFLARLGFSPTLVEIGASLEIRVGNLSPPERTAEHAK